MAGKAVKSFMRANYFEIERSLQVAIDDGKEIELISFALGDDIERTLRAVLERVCSRYAREHLADAVFSCLLELATNGTRANMKRLFFEERGWSFSDPGYDERLVQFKEKSMEGPWIQAYAEKARERGLCVRIHIKHSAEGLRIRVTNNEVLTDGDKQRIKDKIELALRFKNLVEYHLHHGDDSEGQGLGLALAVLILRSHDIDPRRFLWVDSHAGETSANLEIPFSDTFQSARH